MASEQVEREDKYDVPPGFVLPDLTGVAPDATIESHTYRLRATYFDTAADDLRRNRITLRRRTGGHDAGWHLKLPGDDGRTEITVASRAGVPPRELTSLLLGIRRGQRLISRARLSTTRHSQLLRDRDDRTLLEVTDDLVHAQTLGAAPRVSEWREVEVELGPDADDQFLTHAGEVLLAAGATASASASKFARAMGSTVASERRNDLAGLVDDYLQAQYDAIVAGDIGLRRGVNAIHPTRVAIRRLRSTLRVFDALFDPGRLQRLQAELVWYAALLGRVRDVDVQGKRLSEHLAALPSHSVVGSVAMDLDAALAAERETAWHRLRRAMNGNRYLALATDLHGWRTDPPFTAAGGQPPERVGDYVAAPERVLQKRLAKATKRQTDDELFHSARKAAKRYRYANELAEPVLGRPAKLAVERTKDLQTLLGEHQDSVVSAELLHRLGLDARNGFTYGVLLTQQQQISALTRVAVTEATR
jgi:CHAD domain-containing protein